MRAQFIRVVPQTWHNAIAMRFEVVGCYTGKTPTARTPTVGTPTLPPVTKLVSTPEPPKDDCTVWGNWVNSDKALFGSDREAIEDVLSLTPVCQVPMEIQCRRVTDKVAHDKTDQKVLCNTWLGMKCDSKDQANNAMCYDYEVRIGCIDETKPQCVPTSQPSTPSPIPLCQGVKDSSSCPADGCPVGQVCDGHTCMPPEQCPCIVVSGGVTKHIYPGKFMTNDQCQTCTCASGVLKCMNKVCPTACAENEVQELDAQCNCRCTGCASGQFLCKTTKECIPQSLVCDGKWDCNDDEVKCEPTPKLPHTTPAPEPTTSRITQGASPVSRTKTPRTTPAAPTPGPTPPAPTPEIPKVPKKCHLSENMFKTFDNKEYNYEICKHTLVSEMAMKRLNIDVQLHCPVDGGMDRAKCTRSLHITLDGKLIKLRHGQMVEVDGQIYMPYQLEQLSKTLGSMAIAAVGEEMVATIPEFGVIVSWGKRYQTDIQIGSQLFGKVEGLCGDANGKPDDDFKKKDGTYVASVNTFGDSWGSRTFCPPAPVCTMEQKEAARQTCAQLRKSPFSACHASVPVEWYVKVCEADMCNCIKSNGINGLDQCKCDVYSEYMRACAMNQKPVDNWQISVGCAVQTCPPDMVWSECASGCPSTCSNYREKDAACNVPCVPACQCKPGLVKKGDTCVAPTSCEDCVCYGYGDPHYVTFDGSYFPFQGTCTYVLARDTAHTDFEVLAHNEKCTETPATACTQGLTVKFSGHAVEFRPNNKVLYDGSLMSRSSLPHITSTMTLKRVGTHYVLNVPSLHLEVRFSELNHGFQVKLPSAAYFNKTEGLCGTCTHSRADDFMARDKTLKAKAHDFALTWLETPADNSAQCTVVNKTCTSPQGALECNRVYDNSFKACHALVNPAKYFENCIYDTKCGNEKQKGVCDSLTAYARACAMAGVCLDWRTQDLCPVICNNNMVYKECGPSCVKTCDNMATFDSTPCTTATADGCYCKDGYVMKAGVCVKVEDCRK
ncbi:hemocytin-like [Lingula anatina]|uniref:Hemocytin-like n=1 Tax=Lingula anatina TaxID=7574 RepID=A0A1S3I6Z4_LINAN|nr:hemocytin-like [Lingula anatina]|eukprot:XP_013394050.1 hemocytin-like [Lingula anatina]